MSMSIQGPSPDGLLRSLQRTTDRQQRTLSHLATGKRIAGASDDAAGLAIARRLEAEVHSLAQGERNLAYGQGMARTAEGALQGTQDNLIRMRELGIQARNGTLSSADRATIQQEYDQLSAQVDQTAGGTRFGDRALLDGSSSGGSAPGITDGSGGDTTLAIPDAGAAALGIAGLDVADPNTLKALDDASSQVSSVRSELGAADTRFSHQSAAIATSRANAEDSRSRIEDADVAQEVASLTRDRILQSLQISGLGAVAGNHHRVLDLLG
jgi:flagellin